MKLSSSFIQDQCRRQGRSLAAMLREAGVSRTAYYSLARRESILPRSIHALANVMGVKPADLLEEENVMTSADAEELVARADRIIKRHPDASFDNVWHTLMLLKETPEKRLERSLRRGRIVSADR